MRYRRRVLTPDVIRMVLGWWLLVALAPSTQAEDMRVTLLGTGAPPPSLDRFGPSTLVEAGTEKLLFDVGRGASQRFWQLGMPLRAVTGVFLTHFHSDHTVGLPDLWLTGWLSPRFGGRMVPFRVWGPTGTVQMMSALETAYQADIRIRIADQKYPPEGVAILATDITEGVVFERNGVQVTAFDVDHGEAIKPALGYRVDYAGRSVVISGDTRFSENLIRFATGVDLVVHEVAVARPELLARSDAARLIIGHHTTPEDAGRVFERVGPKLALYSHIVLWGDATTVAPTIQDLVERTRTTYTGPLEVGEDLMSIDVGDTVVVNAPVSAGDPASTAR